MPTKSQLFIDPNKINWEGRGRCIATLDGGVKVSFDTSDKTLYIIKNIYFDLSEKEKKSIIKKYEDIGREYYFKIIPKEALSFYSELYQQTVHVIPSCLPLELNEKIIIRLFHPKTDIEIFQSDEKWLKKHFPLGFHCFSLFCQGKPDYIFKLREYTRKVLKAHYRDSNILKGLFSKTFGDMPEDFLMTLLCKILPLPNEPHSAYGVVIDLDKLPYKVKDRLDYYERKEKKRVSIEEIELEDLPYIEDSFIIAALDQLTPIQKEVVTLRFDEEERTLAEVGNLLGKKRQTVWEIEKAALKNLKRILSR